MEAITDIEDLAKFYWELYSHLRENGFEDEQAMKIILKEAKIPRTKTAKREKDLGEMIEDVLKKREVKNGLGRRTNKRSKDSGKG